MPFRIQDACSTHIHCTGLSLTKARPVIRKPETCNRRCRQFTNYTHYKWFRLEFLSSVALPTRPSASVSRTGDVLFSLRALKADPEPCFLRLITKRTMPLKQKCCWRLQRHQGQGRLVVQYFSDSEIDSILTSVTIGAQPQPESIRGICACTR